MGYNLMWLFLSERELEIILDALDLLTDKTEKELAINRAKLFVKINRRLGNDNDKSIKEKK